MLANLRALAASLFRGRYQDDPEASLGVRGEQAAARHLLKQGLRMLATRESDQRGEIDLIALDRRDPDGPTIIFVEVKTLATRKPGHPADRVDQEKQIRISNAALRFLKRRKLLEHRARFDVVAVWWPDPHAAPARIEHFVNAFEACSDGMFG